MNIEENKKTIIYMAPTPPPYMGPSIATQIILNSRFCDEFHVIHIDTVDRRPLSNIGRLDVVNVYLAFKHYYVLFNKLLFSKADLVYIPISQTTIGFLRDVPFIILSKLFRKKVVLHLRGGYFKEFYNSSGRIMKYIIRKTLSKSDRMIVLGECLKPLFDGLIPGDKLSVVPNGADMSFNVRRPDASEKEYFKILFLSNLIESKGFKDVLHSVGKVSAEHDNVRYVFAGDWRRNEDKLECEDYINRENIHDYVEFVGTTTGKQKIELFQDADIFVFPTYYPMEGHPWVIVEALAAGLPIITTDQGCIKESVIHEENGYIIPHRNLKALTERTVQLVENPQLRKKMGFKSRELYEANFTKEHFVQRMINTINHTLNSQQND